MGRLTRNGRFQWLCWITGSWMIWYFFWPPLGKLMTLVTGKSSLTIQWRIRKKDNFLVFALNKAWTVWLGCWACQMFQNHPKKAKHVTTLDRIISFHDVTNDFPRELNLQASPSFLSHQVSVYFSHVFFYHFSRLLISFYGFPTWRVSHGDHPVGDFWAVKPICE